MFLLLGFSFNNGTVSFREVLPTPFADCTAGSVINAKMCKILAKILQIP